MSNTKKHYVKGSVRDLSDADRADLKPQRPAPDPHQYVKAVGFLDDLIDVTADKNAEHPDGLGWALSLRAAWQMIITHNEHVQWDLIQALDEVERLKERIKLIEGALH
ncbi:MAG: hypothetical protein AAFW60_02835 [Pseudomonadota bacterium]